MLFVSMFSTVYAVQPTHQFVKIYMDPLYRESMEEDVRYDYDLRVETPDGMSDVVNAMVTMQLWLNPTIEFELLVNDQHCNNPTYKVHTTYANAGEGTLYFDCSNIITGEGDYVVSIIPDDDTGASTFWIDLTYSNAPEATVDVHGTEYFPGERAKVWVQLINSTGEYVNNASCKLSIYTPTGEKLIENGEMSSMDDDGIYFYDLLSPQAQGVYPVVAKCFYIMTESHESADGFTLNIGDVLTGDYTDTEFLDNSEHKIRQLDGAIDVDYNFDNMCGIGTSEDELAGLTVTVNAKWVDSVTNDNLVMHIYNYSSGGWITLPNRILDPNDRITVTNTIDSNNFTRDGLVSNTGTLRLKFNDTLPTEGTNKMAEFDFIQVTCKEFSALSWQEVKGSSEMHISSDKFWVIDEESIIGNITNELYNGYMYFNLVVSSQTSRGETEQDINKILPTPFPCNHVLGVTVDGVAVNFTGEDSGSEACDVHWDMDLAVDTNYDVVIKTENWWRVEVNSWESETELLNDFITPMCEFYRENKGYPNYTLPLVSKVNHSDNFYRECYNTLDFFYHVNESIYDEFSFGQAVLTYDDMQLLNSDWRHLILSKDEYLDSVNSLLASIGLASDMSQLALNSGEAPEFFNYWANQSTGQLLYDRGGASASEIWNYSGIVSSNLLLQLSTSVWDYSGNISSNILTKLAVAIWTYTDRLLTGFNYEIQSDYVWNNTNAQSASINLTEIANATWEWPTRYTHGVDLT